MSNTRPTPPPDASRCTATTKAGTRCPKWAAEGGAGQCFTHSPAFAERRHGPRPRKETEPASPAALKLDTAEQIKAFIVETIASVQAGKIPARTGIVMTGLARLALSAHGKMLDQRLDEIEKHLDSQPTTRKRKKR